MLFYFPFRGKGSDKVGQRFPFLDIELCTWSLRDRSLFMTGGMGSESNDSNDFLWKIFSRPTRRVEKKLVAYSTLREMFSMPTVIGRNKHVL